MQNAWCRTDCPPENRAVPASPCHNGGTRPAAPPLPEIFACRRRKDRARAGPCGRTTPLSIGYRGLGRMGTGSKHGLETEDYLYATIFHVPRSKSPPIFFAAREAGPGPVRATPPSAA